MEHCPYTLALKSDLKKSQIYLIWGQSDHPPVISGTSRVCLFISVHWQTHHQVSNNDMANISVSIISSFHKYKRCLRYEIKIRIRYRIVFREIQGIGGKQTTNSGQLGARQG